MATTAVATSVVVIIGFGLLEFLRHRVNRKGRIGYPTILVMFIPMGALFFWFYAEFVIQQTPWRPIAMDTGTVIAVLICLYWICKRDPVARRHDGDDDYENGQGEH